MVLVVMDGVMGPMDLKDITSVIVLFCTALLADFISASPSV